jgi:hypothetical protein
MYLSDQEVFRKYIKKIAMLSQNYPNNIINPTIKPVIEIPIVT